MRESGDNSSPLSDILLALLFAAFAIFILVSYTIQYIPKIHSIAGK